MASPNAAGQRAYNAPDGTPSDIGVQFNTFYWQKKALIEMKKAQFFGQQADTTSMPKHFGKTIKKYHYLPLLDDANINDQGIDAAGVIADDSVGMMKATVKVAPNQKAYDIASADHLDAKWFVGEATTKAAALVLAHTAAAKWLKDMHGFATEAAANTAGWIISGISTGEADLDQVPNTGNLYGSSKDVGTINGKLPLISEHGGRVNRVSFKRVELSGSIEKFGFFDEYTKESIDFDTDAELMMHVNREMLRGANEITEDALQMDLLGAAGVIRYGGSATSKATISGETGSESLLDYEDLMKLSIDLDNNRCPKDTKIITGSRMVDTRTVYATRYLYIGSELIPAMKRMTDLFGNQAFIPIHQYANAGTVAVGEIGTVDQFKIIVVPEMMHWAGAGAAVTATNAGYRETGGKYDVFPMLIVGDESFTTIGFQTDGKTTKFKIKHSKPESDMSYSQQDPYGEIGFMSIKWYYGFMVLRPERIALCLTVAEY